MTRWQGLRDSIESARKERKKVWENALIVQLKMAVEKKVCDKLEPYRIKRIGRTIELKPLKDGATMKAKKADIPAIALLNLPAIEDARLSFRVTLQADEKRVQQYTVSAVGERRSGRPWYVRVDLDADQKGEGPCSHAMLHCHMGVDSLDKGGQDSRVPLPWLDPDEALAWVLATLDPRLEPVSIA
jgi:hypothetical protein